MGKPTRRSTRSTRRNLAASTNSDGGANLAASTNSDGDGTAAILTPTHRLDMLPLCLDRIREQTVLNKIAAWILVDGKSIRDVQTWDAALADLRARCRKDDALRHLKVVDGSANVEGAHRNIAAYRNATLTTALKDTACTYFVNFDDDDMYVPLRVEAALKALDLGKLGGYLLCGCSNHLICDPDLEVGYQDLVMQYRRFAPFHCTANTLACTRSYVTAGHRYATGEAAGSGFSFAEEQHFLNKYTEGMIQIPAQLTALQVGHSGNTFLKRGQILGGLNHFLKLSPDKQSCYVSDLKISDIVPRAVYDAYTAKLWPGLRDRGDAAAAATTTDFDVVFYCGHSNPFSVASPGGANGVFLETARALAAAGRYVALYADFPLDFKEQTDSGGHLVLRRSATFSVARRYRVLVLCRPPGIMPILHVRLQAERLILDPQDFVTSTLGEAVQRCAHRENRVAGVVARSPHQKQMLQEVLGEAFGGDIPLVAVPRGGASPDALRWDGHEGASTPPPPRRPHAFVAMMHWKKGLEPVLREQWPVLKRNFPTATIQVLQPFASDPKRTPPLPESLEQALRQPGVTYHGHAPRETVARILSESSWLLHFTACPYDISATSLFDAAVNHVVPFVSHHAAVFSELPGCPLPGDPTTAEGHAQAAAEIVRVVASAGAHEVHADAARREALKLSYGAVANAWEPLLGASTVEAAAVVAPRKKLRPPRPRA